MDLESLQNTTITLLGKSRAFTHEELNLQLQVHNITIVKEVEEGSSLIVEGRMMSPYEQELSERLYAKKKHTFIGIDMFEKMLAEAIDYDTVLMSLKLSNDKMRLKSFLQNGCISDALFLKLLKMYSYKGKDFFEESDNRDVTAALIRRFYKNIQRNHNVEFATTGIYHLIVQTENAELLEALAQLEPVEKHPNILQALALHRHLPKNVQKMFLKKGDTLTKEAMAYNANLEKSIVKELRKESALGAIVAQNCRLDEELFSLLKEYKIHLAANETLSKRMQEELLKLQDMSVNMILAANRGLHVALSESLSALNNDEIIKEIYANSATDTAILISAYEKGGYEEQLSANTATPKEILEVLYKSDKKEVLQNLAENESTPVELLYQLQLDSRFERFVKKNRAFGKHIQSENIGWLV